MGKVNSRQEGDISDDDNVNVSLIYADNDVDAPMKDDRVSVDHDNE